MTKTPPPRVAKVPQGRTSRFMHMGLALGEWAASAAATGLTQLARGERPSWAQVMAAPASARRLAERLSHLRGAVMKVGQLMSMDGHGVLPPQFAELLGGLRDRAHHMPAAQLAQVLQHEYGSDWANRFAHFDMTPLAAASIGQVHRVQTHEGQALVLKIQYPGVRKSIHSDVANLALLARTPGLVPTGLDPAALLARVREQLLLETDYRAEARASTRYSKRLGADAVLWVPALHPAHCTAHILASEFAPGVPLDQVAGAAFTPAQRDHVAGALCRLAVREVFDMRLVQTDPNFGNYLFDATTGRIALLDFGATEAVLPARVLQLRALARALRDADAHGLTAAALAAGFIAAVDPPQQSRGVIEMMWMAGEPLQHSGPYDFGASDLFSRAFEQGKAQFWGDGFARTPPADLVFLQRKFVGTFMQCTKLTARVDLAATFEPYL